MAIKSKNSRSGDEEDGQFRSLRGILKRHGVTVRREKLSRGHAFRVKSGDCLLTGARHVFVDRRLPGPQQVQVLVDFLVDEKIDVLGDELVGLSENTLALLKARELAP